MTKMIMFVAAALMLTISGGVVAPAYADNTSSNATYSAEAGGGGR